MEAIRELLREWERWSAELLESHLSYPVLAYFRSQHDNQSWIAALATILDTSAFVMAGLEGACVRQAQLTFAKLGAAEGKGFGADSGSGGSPLIPLARF